MRSEPIGRLIALRRQELGHSQARLAELLNEIAALDPPTLTRHEISRWERGDRLPRTWLPALATALRLPVEELKAAVEVSRAVKRAGPQESPWEPGSGESVGGERFTPDDEERLVAVARRPSRADGRSVEALEVVLRGQRLTEDIVGSGPLVRPVLAQLSVVELLAREARGAVRHRVLSVAAQWAQFSGWLHANSGRPREASRLYDRALTWATEVGDRNMISTALNMKAHLAWIAGEAGAAAGLAEAAQRGRGITPGVLALAAQQEARGHAMAGDAEAVERKLDEAADLVARAAADPEEEPAWIYFFNPDYLVMQRGLAYRLLGRHDRAAASLSVGLAQMPPEVRASEWIAFYTCRLADSYARLGERDAACAYALDSARVGTATASPELLNGLRALHARLHRHWPAHPDVKTLGEALATTTPSPTDTPA
ncbi:helix-turn-helix transcriptional regulator [Bailinhaonella thermotolerans]|uniref:helix-turn-helix transcriptional regulator n=1 Tax=Bailinhaonella thermotolerans TaxID=1070861 RepID=UPI00192A3232|nr:helix-turn-helix transcriptional regulator [Bailinhaonella thermotolerans]